MVVADMSQEYDRALQLHQSRTTVIVRRRPAPLATCVTHQTRIAARCRPRGGRSIEGVRAAL